MLLCYVPLVYNFSVELTNLEEYDFYYIQVTAMNVIGSSPLSPNLTVQTQEAREFDKYELATWFADTSRNSPRIIEPVITVETTL